MGPTAETTYRVFFSDGNGAVDIVADKLVVTDKTRITLYRKDKLVAKLIEYTAVVAIS